MSKDDEFHGRRHHYRQSGGSACCQGNHAMQLNATSSDAAQRNHQDNDHGANNGGSDHHHIDHHSCHPGYHQSSPPSSDGIVDQSTLTGDGERSRFYTECTNRHDRAVHRARSCDSRKPVVGHSHQCKQQASRANASAAANSVHGSRLASNKHTLLLLMMDAEERQQGIHPPPNRSPCEKFWSCDVAPHPAEDNAACDWKYRLKAVRMTSGKKHHKTGGACDTARLCIPRDDSLLDYIVDKDEPISDVDDGATSSWIAEDSHAINTDATGTTVEGSCVGTPSNAHYTEPGSDDTDASVATAEDCAGGSWQQSADERAASSVDNGQSGPQCGAITNGCSGGRSNRRSALWRLFDAFNRNASQSGPASSATKLSSSSSSSFSGNSSGNVSDADDEMSSDDIRQRAI